jgi:hypothetical protein
LSSFTPVSNESSDQQKLSYLSAWQSMASKNIKLMKFSDSHPICIDTGASCCISNNKRDFIDLNPTQSSTVLKGIGSGLTIAGCGTIKWTISDDIGDEITLHLHNSLYVPDAPMNLLSPQHLAQQTALPSDGFHSKGASGTLTFGSFKRTIPYNSSNNLPILFLASNYSTSQTAIVPHTTNDTTAALLSSLDGFDESRSNLSVTQRKLLHLHQKLGHLHMAKIQALARLGHLGRAVQSISNCEPPLCKACLHGKQHRNSTTSISASGVLDALHLNPGDCISGNQVESTVPGLIPTYRGLPTNDKFHAGTLFIDHASGFLHFTPYISTGSSEAIKAKHSFELLASQYNHVIKSYHTDNGVFASKDFRTSCTQQRQRITFCGVNAHHQNGITERFIRTITERARTMLLHAMISWPDIIQEQLWPFALRMAVDLHNCTPGPSGLTPEEIFTGIKGRNRLTDFHPFGCPHLRPC